MGKNMRDQVKEHYGEIAGKLQKAVRPAAAGEGVLLYFHVNPEAFYGEDLSDLPVGSGQCISAVPTP